MLSKNNPYKQYEKVVPHYGLRKLSIGVASVLLSTSFYLGASQMLANADTINANDATTSVFAPAKSSDDLNQATEVAQSARQVDASSDAESNSPAPAPRSATSDIPAATTSLNDQVGTTNDKITVTSHTVSETEGNKSAGVPGQTNLKLDLNIPPAQLYNIKSGDYIDIKLGLPYTTSDGQQHVMSYGAVNGDATPIVVNYQGVIVGYIIPVGNFNQYAQTVLSNGQLVTVNNDNKAYDSLGTSNGYYQIIFTDGFSQYLQSHPGTSVGAPLHVKLAWYNAVQNEDRKVNLPSAFTIYTNGTDSSDYVPNNDLQVGNYTMASGLHFKVAQVHGSGITLSNETRASDHTGNIPAHRWFKQGNNYYLIADGDNTQGVGISLSTLDENGHHLGNSFDIKLDKPAGNSDVQLNFVSAEDVQKQLQDAIVGESTSGNTCVDQISGDQGQYYLNHQSDFTQPKVKVTQQLSNNGNSIDYHVTIDGNYQGFKSNMDNGNQHDFVMTLITWKPTDPTALLPPADIKTPSQDYAHVIYSGSELIGYPIQSEAVKDYLKDKPWSFQVTSDEGFHCAQQKGYWIDESVDDRPENNGYVANRFYGWVTQTIKYVDENGQPMMNDQGQAISDLVRTVTFESNDDSNDFTGITNQFDDTTVPVVTGYTAYAGIKNGDQLQMLNGKAVTTGAAITQYGHEDPFGYPHPNFIEYIVYKPTSEVQPYYVVIHYIDVDQTVKSHPSQTTFSPTDGIELNDQKQWISGNVGDQYLNNLWDYAHHGYLLATSTVDPNTQSGNIPTIGQPNEFYVYLKHGTGQQAETKTVTETIHYIYRNGPYAGQTAAPDYTDSREFSRTNTVDSVTNNVISYGNWNTVAPFNQVDSPIIEDYTADKLSVPTIGVTPNTDDIVVNVYYSTSSQPTNPDQPDNPQPTPNNPDEPVNPQPQPSTPDNPTSPQNNPSKPTTPSSGNHENMPATTKQTIESNDAQTRRSQLPQTGSTSFLGIVALGFMSLLASLGLGLQRRKNN